MKLTSIIYVLLLTAIGLQAQVVFYIQTPSPLTGTYDITYVGAESGTTDWGSPNMDDPANVIIAELAMARDSTDADSLLCDEVTNGDEIAGKIAVFYRGECNFSTKALHAQNAGAIACLIINNSGNPVPMAGGVDGEDVTIPVAMISTGDGALFRYAIKNGGLIAFFGNKSGYYTNDLGINASTVLRAQYSSYPSGFAYFGGDYNVQVGANIINYGTNDQTDVKLSCTISRNGNDVYSEISEIPANIGSGDTIRFDLPPFFPIYYSGYYKMTYEIIFNEEDEFPTDNKNDANFSIGNTIAYARIDEETGKPLNITGSRPEGAYEVSTCLAFQSIYDFGKVEGITFAASTLGDNMIGEIIDAFVYKWESDFENLDDPNYNLSYSALTEQASASYQYVENLENVNIYLPFDEITNLQYNRYLFCISYYSDYLMLSYDNKLMGYAQNVLFYNQPLIPLYADGEWFDVGGTYSTLRTDQIPALAVQIDFLIDIDDKELNIDITPFPNPAINQINIPIGNYFGKTMIDIYDIAGKKVKSLNFTTTSFETIKVNVSDLDNGAYLFKILFENGSYSNFNVVINNN